MIKNQVPVALHFPLFCKFPLGQQYFHILMTEMSIFIIHSVFSQTFTCNSETHEADPLQKYTTDKLVGNKQ